MKRELEYAIEINFKDEDVEMVKSIPHLNYLELANVYATLYGDLSFQQAKLMFNSNLLKQDQK